VFDRKKSSQVANAELVERFLVHHTQVGRYAGRPTRGVHEWREVPGSEVARLLEEFRVSPSAHRVNGTLLARYLHECLAGGELRRWTVALPSRTDREGSRKFAGVPLGLITRGARKERDDEDAFSVQAVLNPIDELLDLSERRRKAALTHTLTRFDAGTLVTKDNLRPTSADGISARAVRDADRGLLILYAIEAIAEPAEDYSALDADVPLFGFAISFPRSGGDRSISYRVNNVFWQLELGGT
jgi:hypothetical protein